MHGGMGMQGGMSGHGGMHGQQSTATDTPTMSGQDAFGTIQEIVQILQSDPKTDWSKVNIDALRQHLIDMNEVTLHAAAAQRMIDNGIEITVTGEGRTLEAIKRMVPAHVNELHEIGWNAKSEDLPNGVNSRSWRAKRSRSPSSRRSALWESWCKADTTSQHHLMMATGQFVH